MHDSLFSNPLVNVLDTPSPYRAKMEACGFLTHEKIRL